MTGRVVVFGDVIDDVVVVPSGPVRPDTDTPSTITVTAGGSAANAAAWLAAAGASVDFVGRVGEDDVARHESVLRASGVRPVLAGDQEHGTGRIVVIVEGEHRTMLTDRGANAHFTADAVSADVLEEAAAVHFTGYSIFHGDDPTPVRRLIDRAHEAGVLVSLDPASAGGLGDYGVDRFLEVAAGVDLLLPNLDEGRALGGSEDPDAMLVALLDHFPLVALTLGSGGVLVGARGGEPIRVEAARVTAIDPTGAGDAFGAGFLATLIGGGLAVGAVEDARVALLRRAGEAGVSLAARAVTTLGGRPAAS